MEIQNQHNSKNLMKFMDKKKGELEERMKQMIDVEWGLYEMSLAIQSLGQKKLNEAHEDTESFKKEIRKKAKKLAEKSGRSMLTEFKELTRTLVRETVKQIV